MTFKITGNFYDRAFDVELLYIAQQLGIPIEERAVNWEEIDGKIIYKSLPKVR